MILSKKAIKDKIINSEKTKYYKGINVKKYDLSDEKFILSTMNNRSKRKLYRYMKTKKNLKSNQHLLLNFFDKLFNRKTNDKLKTHVRNCIITPSMINKKIYVYNGNSYSYIELQTLMLGKFLGEFSLTYKPVKHGNPGIGATHSSRFIPLR